MDKYGQVAASGRGPVGECVVFPREKIVCIVGGTCAEEGTVRISESSIKVDVRERGMSKVSSVINKLEGGLDGT